MSGEELQTPIHNAAHPQCTPSCLLIVAGTAGLETREAMINSASGFGENFQEASALAPFTMGFQVVLPRAVHKLLC